jgi:hypothetical protein
MIATLFSYWFCCGGRAFWAKKKRRVTNSVPSRETNAQANEDGQQMREVEAHGDAPPMYEESVPLQHHTLAGGMAGVRNEEEDGMIADGKMPLSEIPFEDVVVGESHTSISSSSSFSNSRQFAAIHHNGIGNTYGHTNS